jgi:hypothetical protein
VAPGAVTPPGSSGAALPIISKIPAFGRWPLNTPREPEENPDDDVLKRH